MKSGTSVFHLQVNSSTAKACPSQLVGPTEPHRNIPHLCVNWLYNSIRSDLSFFHYLLHSNGNQEVILLHLRKNNAFILFSTSFAQSRYHNFITVISSRALQEFYIFCYVLFYCCHEKLLLFIWWIFVLSRFTQFWQTSRKVS